MFEDNHVIRLQKAGGDRLTAASLASAPVQPVIAQAPMRPPHGRGGFLSGTLVLVALLSTVALVTYAIGHRAGVKDARSASLASAAASEENVAARVSALILAPDEVPTIALVKDLAPLQGMSFFEHAKVGDVVLMYERAQKAILFDPDANKVIEVGPMSTAVQ